jgi:soluble lytic murein transglycosylase-like protein
MTAARGWFPTVAGVLELVSVGAEDGQASVSQRRAENFEAAKETASRLSIDPATFLALVWVGSRGDDRVISRNRKNFGLTQISHEVAALHGVTDRKRILEPMQNLEIGGKYLRRLLKMAGGREDIALHAYNAGWGRVRKASTPGRSRYVDRVMAIRGIFIRCLAATSVLSCAEKKRKQARS